MTLAAGTLRKQGDRYLAVVVVPWEDVERLQLREGQTVLFDAMRPAAGGITAGDDHPTTTQERPAAGHAPMQGGTPAGDRDDEVPAVLILSEEEAGAVAATMEHPPAPSDALRATFAHYRQLATRR